MDEDATPSQPALQRWRKGEIGVPSLVALLLVLAVAGLAAASINGWGGIAVVVILILGFIALISSWAISA